MSKPLVDPRESHSVPFEVHEEHLRCCGRAVKLLSWCVCRWVMTCPEHGDKHMGDHG